METEQIEIYKLIQFKQRDKFSTKAWNDRGLNPSSTELCIKLTQLFNSSADNLINQIKLKSSSRELKSSLKQDLSKFNKNDFNTEEKEFICDLFLELAAITNINLNDDLSKWLYGSLLTNLLKLKKLLNAKKNLVTLSQPCTNCETQLESYILKKENGIPESRYYIVRCKNCKELNLLSCGPNIKELKFGNYDYVEALNTNEYNYEQALTRFEQIKFFRK